MNRNSHLTSFLSWAFAAIPFKVLKGKTHYSPHLTVGKLRTTKDSTVLPRGETLRTAFKVHSSLFFQSIKCGMGHVIIFDELYVHNFVLILYYFCSYTLTDQFGWLPILVNRGSNSNFVCSGALIVQIVFSNFVHFWS